MNVQRVARTLALAMGLLSTFAASACSGPKIKPDWASSEVGVPNEQILWEVSLLALERAGYPVGAGADPAARTIVSGWKKSLAPFKGEGFRNKATVAYETVEGGRYEVKVRVERESNEDLFRPIDPTYAQWKPTQDDQVQARLVLQYIQSYLGGEIEIGEPRKNKIER